MACGFSIVISIVVLIVVALVAHRIRRRPIAYRHARFHPGEAVILGAYIPRRFPQLISSAPAHRLIRPTARYSILAARRGSVRQGKAAGGETRRRERLSAALALGPVSRIVLALVSPLVSAGWAKSVSFLVASRATAIRLASLARFAPVPLLVSAPWLALDPAVNRRKGKAKRPAPLIEERGEKHRFNRKASL